MDKKIVLLVLVLCFSMIFVGCGKKKMEVEFPETPENYRDDFWRVSYAAYALISNSIEEDIDLTDKESEYITDYLKSGAIEAETLEEKQLVVDISDLAVNHTTVKYLKLKGVSDEEIKEAVKKMTDSLDKLNDFYKNLEK